MDLKSGSAITVKTYRTRTIKIEHHVGGGFTVITLTTEEARTLANVLLAAVVEAESQPA